MPDGVRTTPPPPPAVTDHSQDAADARDLAGFGYKQELKRVLGVYSSFAVAFSYISPSTGIFTLYALGLGLAGGFFFWSWPIVALGQFLVALNFAEVSSHFPLAGSVYQWSKYLANRHYSWFNGWIYLFAGILTVTGVDLTVPIVLVPFLNGLPLGISIPTGFWTPIVIGLLVLLSTTLLNIFGVRLVSIVNNTGVVFEILGMVVLGLVLLIFFHHQSPAILVDTSHLGVDFGSSAGIFMAAMFMSLFVIYGFDTASTLAEETRNPRREAPRAVLASIIGAFVIGTVFMLATIFAIPGDANKFISDTAAGKASPPVDIITRNFGPGSFGSELYLFIVLAAVYVCCLAIQTSTIRLAFGMARDGKLPLGRIYNRVSPSLHTPVGTCIVIGALSAIPVFYAGAGTVAIVATCMIYLSYFLGNIAILVARSKGWPRADAPFKLGSWGTVVNVLALLWGGSMLINFLWPRPLTIINPSVKELPGLSALPLIGDIPIVEATIGIVLIVGVIYYLVAQRNRPAEPLPETAAISA
jgi:urea carboxylase system permease